MAAGDITYKYSKITVNPDTGVINYAEQKCVEDSDGNLHEAGLHRPGPVPPVVRNSNDDGWDDNVITDKPQIIQDIASGVWTSDRKANYEDANS